MEECNTFSDFTNTHQGVCRLLSPYINTHDSYSYIEQNVTKRAPWWIDRENHPNCEIHIQASAKLILLQTSEVEEYIYLSF